jgi:hypothetical protein
LKKSLTVRSFLEHASAFVGDGATLDLSAEQFMFVQDVKCRICSVEIPLNRAAFRIFDYESVCDACRDKIVPASSDEVPATKRTLSRFSFDTAPNILDLSLGDLGVPAGHVLAVTGYNGTEVFLELTGDIPALFDSIGVRSSPVSAGQPQTT